MEIDPSEDITDVINQEESEDHPSLSTFGVIPPLIHGFIGRKREAGEIIDYFENGGRLLTIKGSGGVGKTQLVISLNRKLKQTFFSTTFVCKKVPQLHGRWEVGDDAHEGGELNILRFDQTKKLFSSSLFKSICEHLGQVSHKLSGTSFFPTNACSLGLTKFVIQFILKF